MSITRRQFLISSTRAGVGLILPSYYEKVLGFFENHGEPLLEVPARIDEILYADYGGSDYQLNLGMPAVELPEMTWRDVFDRYYWSGYMQEPEDMKELKDEYGLTAADLDRPADHDAYMDYWCRSDSPNARAFNLLDGLDIGTELQRGKQVGRLVFYDGPMPGSDYLGVHAECGVTLSLLQQRLNELNSGIKVLPI